jgi:putative membrane protein
VAVDPPLVVALAALTLVQATLAALAVSVVLTVVEYYDFTLVREGDDLRYQRGLLRKYSGTIPLAKVQTVTVRENVLMRRFGFATLVVETAGYSGGSQQSTQGVAVPMAPRATVYELARDIEPFGSVDIQRPPKRARRRYAARFAILAGALTVVAYAVDSLLVGSGYWWLSLALFAAVPPAAHLRWRHRGYALTEDVFVAQSGFWRQKTSVVPYYRIQTVFVGRSPFQRRRRLASLTADTASTASLLGGSATAHDIDDGSAGELRETLRRRLYRDLLARRSDRESSAE